MGWKIEDVLKYSLGDEDNWNWYGMQQWNECLNISWKALQKRNQKGMLNKCKK